MKLLIKLTTCLCLSFTAAVATQWIDLDKSVLTDSEKQQIKTQIRCDPNLVFALNQMAYDTVQILDKNEISYNLMFGSLLGAVRNQSMIAHDDDIDFAILKKDEEKLIGTTEIFNQLGYRLFIDGSDYQILKDGDYVNGPNYVGYKLYATQKIKLTTGEEVYPFLDLFTFIWDEVTKMYILDAPEGRKTFPRAQLKQEWVSEQADYRFGNLTLKGPKDYNAVLTHFYGESWDKIIKVTHLHNTKLPNRYLWKITDADRQPMQLAGTLKERVQDYFVSGIIPGPLAVNN